MSGKIKVKNPYIKIGGVYYDGVVASPEDFEIGPRNETPLTKAKIKAIQIRSRGMCEIKSKHCTGEAFDIHHVLHRALGGPNHIDNLKNACRACHGREHPPRQER